MTREQIKMVLHFWGAYTIQHLIENSNNKKYKGAHFIRSLPADEAQIVSVSLRQIIEDEVELCDLESDVVEEIVNKIWSRLKEG